MSILAPTVVAPSGSSAATANIAAFSINATKAGVANTGKSPDPIVNAKLSGCTTVRLICFNPFSNIVTSFLIVPHSVILSRSLTNPAPKIEKLARFRMDLRRIM